MSMDMRALYRLSVSTAGTERMNLGDYDVREDALAVKAKLAEQEPKLYGPDGKYVLTVEAV